MAVFVPVKQFKITTNASSTPTAALSLESAQLPSAVNKYTRQVRVWSPTTNVVLKFGGSTVAASNTVTSNAFADDNFVQPASESGGAEAYDLRSDQTHVSAVHLDGTTAGDVYITLGYGEMRTVS